MAQLTKFARCCHEMSFVEFAIAIRPSWSVGSLSPLKETSSHSEWLTSLWNSADKRSTYGVFWYNQELANELPLEAREYAFVDREIHPFTKILGLDPDSHTDNRTVAELLATRNAWVTAIQNNFQQTIWDEKYNALTDLAINDYLILTSDWIQHPWIKEKIVLRLQEKIQEELEHIGNELPADEMSVDPKWPNTIVINGTSPELLPHELAELEEEENNIKYWLNKFEFELGKWSSLFDMVAWNAEQDVKVANRKMLELQKIIDKQKELIQSLDRTIRINKRRDAEVSGAVERGRPRKSTEQQDIEKKFTIQWVKSIIYQLEVNGYAQLEKIINGSEQRNWQRWLNGKAVPTIKSLSALLTSEITSGKYKGKQLQEVKTNPTHEDLLSLFRLTSKVLKEKNSSEI